MKSFLKNAFLITIFIIVITNAYSIRSVAISGPNAHVNAPCIGLGEDVFISINSVAKCYGMTPYWNSKSKIATLKSNDYNIFFLLNSKTITINGNKSSMVAPTRLVKGKIMIPADFAQNQIKELMVKFNPKEAPLNNKKSFLIMIDPGHGGDDQGTTKKGRVLEKNINLQISKFLGKELQKKGFKVVFTRTTDKFVSLWKRTNLAEKYNADLFISIHANSAPNKKATGIEIFYFHRPTKSQNGINFKKNYYKSKFFARLASQHLSSSLKVENRGSKHARYYVIRNAKTPSVLIETGFLSNTTEAKKLASTQYQKRMAGELTNIIVYYHRKVSGH